MTEDSNITFRYAEEKDCSLILTFIRELATCPCGFAFPCELGPRGPPHLRGNCP